MINFPPPYKSKIERRINAWSKKCPYGQRVARNIFTEHFLPDDKMTDLLLFIATDPLTSWKLFEANYKAKCHSLALQGGNIRVKKRPLFFGVGVEYETFFKHLKDNYPSELGYSGNDVIVKDFILRLRNGMLSKNLGGIIKLKQYSVWATWNMDDLSGMPFDYCKTNLADEIRANMGLRRDDAEKSTSLLLFAYTIPPHIEPLRPTIADAELSQYFEPPVPTFEKHGWTVNWQHEERMTGYNILPRPECIHDSILLSELILPVDMRL